MRLIICFIIGAVGFYLVMFGPFCTAKDTVMAVADKATVASVPVGKRVTADTGDVFHYEVNPCALVPQSSVESFLKHPVAKPSFSLLYDIPPRLVCSYVAKVQDSTGTTQGVSRLRIQVVDKSIARQFGNPTLDTPEKFFTIQAEALHDVRKDFEQVENLSVPAYREPSNGNLHLLINDIYVQVSCEMAGDQEADPGKNTEALRVARNTEANERFAENYLVRHADQ